MILAQVLGTVVSTRKDSGLMSLKLLLTREVDGAFKTITAGFSRNEQAALFLENARRVYRVEVASSAARLAAGEEEKRQDQRTEEDAPPSR